MRRLGSEGFAHAAAFLRGEARPLEQALFAFRFEGGSGRAVLEALGPFRNDDGGFGRALEPDVRTPSSSALATALGLGVLQEVGVAPSHDHVRGAVDWVRRAFDLESQVWRVVPEDTNDYPHAPWWHDEDGGLASTFDGFRIIPRALLVAMLHHHLEDASDAWLENVTESTVRHVETADILGEGGGSDLEYVSRLARTEALPVADRRRLLARLREAIPRVVERDPAKWDTYCITPTGAVPRPDAPGAELIPDLVDAHLDFLIDRQTESGSWDPTWAFEYPGDWAEARTEWRGIITLETLSVLRAFDRL